jgi:hypothetical protein
MLFWSTVTLMMRAIIREGIDIRLPESLSMGRVPSKHGRLTQFERNRSLSNQNWRGPEEKEN